MKTETATFINNYDNLPLTVGDTYNVISKTYDTDDIAHIIIINDVGNKCSYPAHLFVINGGGR